MFILLDFWKRVVVILSITGLLLFRLYKFTLLLLFRLVKLIVLLIFRLYKLLFLIVELAKEVLWLRLLWRCCFLWGHRLNRLLLHRVEIKREKVILIDLRLWLLCRNRLILKHCIKVKQLTWRILSRCRILIFLLEKTTQRIVIWDRIFYNLFISWLINNRHGLAQHIHTSWSHLRTHEIELILLNVFLCEFGLILPLIVDYLLSEFFRSLHLTVLCLIFPRFFSIRLILHLEHWWPTLSYVFLFNLWLWSL